MVPFCNYSTTSLVTTADITEVDEDCLLHIAKGRIILRLYSLDLGLVPRDPEASMESIRSDSGVSTGMI